MSDTVTDAETATYCRSTVRRLVASAVTVGVLLLAMSLVAAWNIGRASTADDRAAGAEQKSSEVLIQARALGQGVAESPACQPVNDQGVDQYGYLCAQARKVADADEPSASDLEALSTAVAAQLQDGLTAKVRAEVERYLAANPLPESVPVEQTRAVVQELVDAAIAALPPATPATPGKPGADGLPGRPPTADEIAAVVTPLLPGLVDAWLAAHPITPALCPDGQVSDPVVWDDGRAGSRCIVDEEG